MKKRIIVSVINDLVSDRRVYKHCTALSEMGYDLLLIGRQFPNSPEMYQAKYDYHRMKLFFRRGVFFYLFFNIRLFFFLLKQKVDILYANDLDTLLANYLVSKIKRVPLIYDTHELFTEVPELQSSWSRWVWILIEKWIFPKLKYVITVNQSIADIYQKKYGVDIKVIRNIPLRNSSANNFSSKKELGLDENSNYIILQGAGININRGAEEAVLAMKYLKNIKLLIIGSGDVFENLKEIIEFENLSDYVLIYDRMEYDKLMKYTAIAELGLTLDKDTNLNYRYSLPNKLFDYLQAGIPVLSSNLPEIKRIIDNYKVGEIVYNHNPVSIASKIKQMLEEDYKSKLKENLAKASSELVWENEAYILKGIMKNIENEK